MACTYITKTITKNYSTKQLSIHDLYSCWLNKIEKNRKVKGFKDCKDFKDSNDANDFKIAQKIIERVPK